MSDSNIEAFTRKVMLLIVAVGVPVWVFCKMFAGIEKGGVPHWEVRMVVETLVETEQPHEAVAVWSRINVPEKTSGFSSNYVEGGQERYLCIRDGAVTECAERTADAWFCEQEYEESVQRVLENYPDWFSGYSMYTGFSKKIGNRIYAFVTNRGRINLNPEGVSNADAYGDNEGIYFVYNPATCEVVYAQRVVMENFCFEDVGIVLTAEEPVVEPTEVSYQSEVLYDSGNAPKYSVTVGISEPWYSESVTGGKPMASGGNAWLRIESDSVTPDYEDTQRIQGYVPSDIVCIEKTTPLWEGEAAQHMHNFLDGSQVPKLKAFGSDRKLFYNVIKRDGKYGILGVVSGRGFYNGKGAYDGASMVFCIYNFEEMRIEHIRWIHLENYGFMTLIVRKVELQ